MGKRPPVRLDQQDAQARRHSIQSGQGRTHHLHHRQLQDAAICRRSGGPASEQGSPAGLLQGSQGQSAQTLRQGCSVQYQENSHGAGEKVERQIPQHEKCGRIGEGDREGLQREGGDADILLECKRIHRHRHDPGRLHTVLQVHPPRLVRGDGAHDRTHKGLHRRPRVPVFQIRQRPPGQASGRLDHQAFPLHTGDAGGLRPTPHGLPKARTVWNISARKSP